MTSNRYWQLDKNPEGRDFEDALSFQEASLPPLEEGQVRVRNEYLSMDAGTRMWMGPREDGYQPPLPLHAPMVGLGLGRVAESRDERFPEGTLVRAFGQWADYSTVTPEESWAVALEEDGEIDVRQHLGVLGLNGWTALYGVDDILGVKEGDVLVVSAAAGATGMQACQIGKLLGARVIGIAGGPEKCSFLREEVGCDLAIDYKSMDVAAALAEFDGAPTAFFENVGGPILDAVLPTMAHYGRVAVCGLIAGYDRDEAMPGPASFDQVLMRRLKIQGFFLPDVPEKGPAFYARLKEWLKAGKMFLPFDETEGLENTLVAYKRMMTGKNIGKAIVKL